MDDKLDMQKRANELPIPGILSMDKRASVQLG